MTLEYAPLDELIPKPRSKNNAQMRRQKKDFGNVPRGHKQRETTCDLLEMKHSKMNDDSVINTFLEGDDEDTFMDKMHPDDTYQVQGFPGIMPNQAFDVNHNVSGVLPDGVSSHLILDGEGEEFNEFKNKDYERPCGNGRFKENGKYKTRCGMIDEDKGFNTDSNTLLGTELSREPAKQNDRMSRMLGMSQMSGKEKYPDLDDIFEDVTYEEERGKTKGGKSLNYVQNNNYVEKYPISYSELEEEEEHEKELEELEEEEEVEEVEEVEEEEEENDHYGRSLRRNRTYGQNQTQTAYSSTFDVFLYLVAGLILIFALEQILYIGTLFIKKI